MLAKAPRMPWPICLRPHHNAADHAEVLGDDVAFRIGFKLSGKLHDEDYKKFVPLVDAEIVRDDKINVLAQFHDFHGWDAKAVWTTSSSPRRTAPRSGGSPGTSCHSCFTPPFPRFCAHAGAGRWLRPC
jgi:hypothetical protein